jgi:hypothetical protein
MSGDTRRWRQRADEFIRAAGSAASLESREELTALAHSWLRRAGKTQSHDVLRYPSRASSKEYVAPAVPRGSARRPFP